MKVGRPRNYTIFPAQGIAVPEIALYVSWLRELRERVYDQIEDLSVDDLNAVDRHTGLSIGKLCIHLAGSENQWMKRIGDPGDSDNLKNVLKDGKLTSLEADWESEDDAACLIALCERVWHEVTIPVSRDITEIGMSTAFPGVDTAGKVFLHLLWHWTYHSGHIGLLAHQLGRDYQWKFQTARDHGRS